MTLESRKGRRQPGSVSRRDGIIGQAGVVGMGLMGTSIVACLLGAGHRVSCVERDPQKLRTASARLKDLLDDAYARGLLSEASSGLLQRTTIAQEFIVLQPATVVIESTIEDVVVKRAVIREIEKVVTKNALIGSNTSAIPITELQRKASHPDRILGLHWGEPANINRFMEVICGKKTSPNTANRAMRLARRWGKEPSLLRRDIRGFITNRIMYAMLREAFHLVEAGYASIADVDRSVRNDLGYWITFAGPFRFMDLTGIPAYAAVMKELLPDLEHSTKVPRLMRKVVGSGARGVANAKGFYRYTPAQAKRWEQLFLEFSHEIRDLAGRYPADAGDRPTTKSAPARRIAIQ
jgi:3-hydroxybutyryl-CoA dehydrogenase